MHLFLLERGKEKLEFALEMRRCMCFTTVFEIECSLDLFLDLEKVMNIRGNGLAVELVVEFSTVFLYHIFEPLVVVLLMQIGRNPFPEFALDI